MKNIRLIVALSLMGLFLQLNAQTTVMSFSFEGSTAVTVDNAMGTPLFSNVGTSTHGFFTGLNSTCSGTTAGESAYSRTAWDDQDAYQFLVNTTGYAGLSFSACLRISERLNAGSMSLQVSVNGGAYTTISTVSLQDPANTTGTRIVPISGDVSAGDNAASITIRLLKVGTLPDALSAIRLDNAILTSSMPLPVKYASFDAKTEKTGVLLNWVTLSELNHSHFDVERSIDGYIFDKIYQSNQDGSRSTNTYEYLDKSAKNGVNYYRLKQVDLDGHFEYSEIVQAKFDNRLSGILFNAVGYNQWEISTSDENSKMIIYDVSGKLVYEQDFSGEATYNPDSHQMGTYIAKITTNRDSKSFRFVVK
jgi:hypothetical protein